MYTDLFAQDVKRVVVKKTLRKSLTPGYGHKGRD